MKSKGRIAKVATLLISACFAAARNSKGRIKQSAISDTFEQNPEDLLDLTGTPWILVSEFPGDALRDETGQLSLFNTRNTHLVPLTKLKTATVGGHDNVLSPLADPTCEPRSLDSISPHGIAGYNNGDGTWEIAVVNHFAYESIEFYTLDFNADSEDSEGDTRIRPLLQSAGCVIFQEGDVHNNLAYNSDKSILAVTLWFDKYFGPLGQANVGQIVASSLFFNKNKGDGQVKLIRKKGRVKTISEGLLAPNGIRWSRDDQVLFVAESPINSKQSSILAIDPKTGRSSIAFQVDGLPDNIGSDDTPSEQQDDVFLVTVAPFSKDQFVCSLAFLPDTGACDNLEFSVVRYNYSKDQTTQLYTSRMNGQASIAMIKNGVGYTGSYNRQDLVTVRGFAA